MVKAFKYKIKPNATQRELLCQSFGCARFIYNWGLGLKIKTYEDEKKNIPYKKLSGMLTALKEEPEYKWLQDCPAACLQQSLIHLNDAYKRFFREKKGYPKFKSKKTAKRSLTFPQDVRFDFNRWKVFVPVIGWIRLYLNREIDLSKWTTKGATVSMDSCGEFWISVNCQDNKIEPAKAKLGVDTAVGIDLGIKDFAILSDGTKIPNHRFLERTESKLAHLQREFSRKVKDSKRREKFRRKLAKCHRKVHYQRMDFLHKLTTELVCSKYDTFCFENLNVQGMQQNHCLAKAISSVGWFTFKTLLKQKCDFVGKNVLSIDRYEPTSKTCSTCGYKMESMPLNIRSWECPHCGAHHDRDINAAINIRNVAIKENTA